MPSESKDQETLKTVEVLKNSGVKFNCFNTLIDYNLSKFILEESKSTTFPLFYVNGKLIGGLNEVQNL